MIFFFSRKVSGPKEALGMLIMDQSQSSSALFGLYGVQSSIRLSTAFLVSPHPRKDMGSRWAVPSLMDSCSLYLVPVVQDICSYTELLTGGQK